MHSRIGLKTRYIGNEWFDRVRDCVDEAKKTGLETWLYDEDRWPSGAAGGLVTRDPRYRSRLLHFSKQDVREPYSWPDCPYTYVYEAVFEGDKLRKYKKLESPRDVQTFEPGTWILEFTMKTCKTIPWFNNGAHLNEMDEAAVAKFIDVTHEAYLREVGKEFGKDIPGIFTDEACANPMMRPLWGWEVGIPWTECFAEKALEWFGEDLTQHLPELVYDVAGQSCSRARYYYFRTRSRLFTESFCKQIGQWCEKHHLLFTGHMLEEAPVQNSVSVIGSLMPGYQYFQAPGIDVLTQYSLEYLAAKQCVSVARQCGRKWITSELYGCTGWETTFEAYKFSGDWQAALGITLRCPHLAWYSIGRRVQTRLSGFDSFSFSLVEIFPFCRRLFLTVKRYVVFRRTCGRPCNHSSGRIFLSGL